MFTTGAFAAPAAGAPLAKMALQRCDIGPNDVLIDTSYRGTCRTAIHNVRAGGEAEFPAGAWS